MAEKVAASVTIHDAGSMTKKGRTEIAAWLRKTAHDLVLYGEDYSKKLTARYWYTEGDHG